MGPRLSSQSTSQPQEEAIIPLLHTTNEAIIHGNPIIPLHLITRLTEVGKESLCKFQVGQTVGSGFLGCIAVNEKSILKGFFTNNHVLPGSAFSQEIHISFELLNVSVRVTAADVNYFFTCQLLDATFIQLNTRITDRLVSKGARFLNVNTRFSPVGSNFYVVQHPLGGDASLSSGALKQHWGFDIRHAASTQPGSSGSPLLDIELQVIAIHKGSYRNEYNRATNMRYVLSAIKKDYPHFTHLPPRAPQQLKAVDTDEILNLLKLVKQDVTTCAYVSPSSFTVTPIWFRRTHHHWYWTPTDPQKQEANWMQISRDDSRKVIGGTYDGIEPAFRNCVIIDYLKRHGDFYCF